MTLPKITLTLMLGIALMFSAASCKKDEEGIPKNPTKSLTSGGWILTAATIDPGMDYGDTTITDYYSILQACTKDNVLSFKSDKTYTYDEGASKCLQSAPQTTSGTWAWNADETAVTITHEAKSQTYTVKQLSDDKMTVSYVQTEEGKNYTITQTYSH